MSKTATIPEFNLISFEIHPKAPLPSLLQTPPHNNTPKKTAKFTSDIKVRKKRGKSMRQKQVMKKKGKRKENGDCENFTSVLSAVSSTLGSFVLGLLLYDGLRWRFLHEVCGLAVRGAGQTQQLLDLLLIL